VNNLDFLDERIDWQIKLIGTFILIFFYFEQFRKEGPIALVGCALVLLLYLVLVWTRKDWWNGIKYSAITAFIIAITLVLKYIFSVRSEDLLWPMVCILATVYGKYSRLSVILASFTILVILLMTSINPFPFANLLALVGVFVGLRSRKIRQDAYRMSHLHLQELNDAHKELQQAHAELQEASVHSMRYAALEERTRLAREIHDGLGHQLTSLIVQLQALEIMLPDVP
jgi:signal transduction histidine kinase